MRVLRLARSVGIPLLAASCECLVTRESGHVHITRCSLPPSEEGEWWELTDEARGGIPYYYQTKTGETVWERPDAFVIPLGILQARN